MMLDQCPDCRVDLEDRNTDVRCWKCGWTVRAAEDSRGYADRSDAIADREAFMVGPNSNGAIHWWADD